MESTNSVPGPSRQDRSLPWQLQMFKRTLKKQQKLRALLGVLGDVRDKRCLLITCGDNNGALNWHLKQHGGQWSWSDAEAGSVRQIGELTGDPVVPLDKTTLALPFADGQFDVVMTIDVHEHLPEPDRLNLELARLVRPGGRVIVTTPNGDERKLVNRIKRLAGMHPEAYGHLVTGYDVPDLERQLRRARLRPYGNTSYSQFFTELLEFGINFAYVKVLSRRRSVKVETGQIAPQSEDQLKSVGKSYRLYALLYPFMAAISKLDVLAGTARGYAVIVVARKV